MKNIVRLLFVLTFMIFVLVGCGEAESIDATEDTVASQTTESPETDDTSNNISDKSDEYRSRPGVYREEDYPDQPATEGLIYVLSPDKDSYYVKGYEGTEPEVYIPDTHEGLPVTQIDSWWEGTCCITRHGAFTDNEVITSVFIGKNVEIIMESAFGNCVNLKTVVIPDSVREISSAFVGCTSLSEIVISDNVELLSSSAFNKTAYFDDEKNWTDGALYVGNHLNSGKDVIGEYEVRAGTKTVSSSAFRDNEKVTEISLPEGLKVIGGGAFRRCTALKEVSISDGIEKISASAFSGASSLTDINIPESVNKIGEGAFDETGYYNRSSNWENGILYLDNCVLAVDDSVKGRIVLKDGTRVIADYAMRHCKDIMSVTLPKSLMTIGKYAFHNCYKLFEVYDLSSLDIENMESADNGGILERVKNVYTSTDVPSKFVWKNEYLFYCDDEKKQYFLVDYNGWSSKLALPSDINGNKYEISDYAFYYDDFIATLYIPDGVKSVGELSFYHASKLREVKIESRATVIGDWAFGGCESLTDFEIVSGVTSIGMRAFDSCYNLDTVVLADGLESIGSWAFSSCRSLTAVYYNGTEAQWNQIDIAKEGNTDLLEATTYFYSETKPTTEGNYWHYVDGVPTVWTVE